MFEERLMILGAVQACVLFSWYGAVVHHPSFLSGRCGFSFELHLCTAPCGTGESVNSESSAVCETQLLKLWLRLIPDNSR